ncbi:MAG TPA: DUF1385 domain-containing protein [Candidatus Baltobacterales bacterium]|nr:DUF1385 domain-containing protein [Candidatus Baltobacterales bacterium]
MPIPDPSGAESVGVAPHPRQRGGEQFFYGGQAVIEGVMMRGKTHYAVAVRLPNTKEILVDRGELKASIYVNPVWKLPFVRGLALIAEQMHLGMKSLIWAANQNAGGNDIEIGKKEITGSVAVAGVFALAVFIGLPLLLAGVAVRHSGGFLFVLVEGLIRVVLVLGYLAAIAMLPDVRRVFQYHGAEHKTINAFESGWSLEVPSVRRASTLHPRCGTGFLLVVLVISVVVFSVVALFHPNWFWLVASRVLAIPLIAGVGFELIRFMAHHRYNPVVKVALLPVLGTQKFTTREPSDDMLEVAIAAFNSARQGEEEKAQGGQVPLVGNPPDGRESLSAAL